MPKNRIWNKQDDISAYLRIRSRPGENGCRVWTGATYTTGHGKFHSRSRGKLMRAHRASYEAHVGPIPAGMAVCHRCDVPACINPDHLFLGTIADNNRDKLEKGRHPFGVKNGQSKLTDWRVLVLRRAYATGYWSHQRLAAKLGISFNTIYSAVTGKTWAHVSDHLSRDGIGDG